jgi:hypothetical protein
MRQESSISGFLGLGGSDKWVHETVISEDLLLSYDTTRFVDLNRLAAVHCGFFVTLVLTTMSNTAVIDKSLRT